MNKKYSFDIFWYQSYSGRTQEHKKAMCNSRFVCDITYLTGCDETWYLSVIEDLFNGEIVGWKIGEHCTAALCIETVMMMKETIGKVDKHRNKEYTVVVTLLGAAKKNVLPLLHR